MIIYFANRNMEILGMASTALPEGLIIANDVKKEDIDSGVASFSCDLYFYTEERSTLESYCSAGNYILRANGDEHEFYTIIESETDVEAHCINIYAEDAGLDLLNELAPAYEATEEKSAEFYVSMFIEDSGFEIGNNDLVNDDGSAMTRQLKWDSESTITARILDIATEFDVADVSYSFEIEGLKVVKKYVNLYKRRGKDTGEQLRVGKEINNITINRSVANLATALLPVGNSTNGIQTTLKGYTYDDGSDFYVDSETGQLRSRTALAKWTRYNMESGSGDGGYIVKSFSYDTDDQETLKDQALTELKSVCDVEINYTIDVSTLPEGIKIGDTINVIDDAGELYIQSRLLALETSVVNNTKQVTLGEHLIKNDGIASLVSSLADDFSTRVIARIDIPSEAASRVNSLAGNLLQHGIGVTGPWKTSQHKIDGTYGSTVDISQGLYTVVADPGGLLGFKIIFNDYTTAPAFNSATTYNAGDSVLYQGRVYSCNEDDTQGAWDPDDWTESTRTIRILATTSLSTISVYWSIFDTANNYIGYNYIPGGSSVVDSVLDQDIEVNIAASSVDIGIGSLNWSKVYNVGNIHFCNDSGDSSSTISSIRNQLETTVVTTNELSSNQQSMSTDINNLATGQTTITQNVTNAQSDISDINVVLNGGTKSSGEVITTGVLEDLSDVKSDLEDYKRNVSNWIRWDTSTGLTIGEETSTIISRQDNQSYKFVDTTNNSELLKLDPNGATMDQANVNQLRLPKAGRNWAIRAESNGNLSIVYLG